MLKLNEGEYVFRHRQRNGRSMVRISPDSSPPDPFVNQPPQRRTGEEQMSESTQFHLAAPDGEAVPDARAAARPLTREEEDEAWDSVTEQGCSCCTAAVRLFCRINGIPLADCASEQPKSLSKLRDLVEDLENAAVIYGGASHSYARRAYAELKRVRHAVDAAIDDAIKEQSK